MFVLTSVEDKVKILPSKLDRDSEEVLIEEVEAKYANKILPGVGLGICCYDFVRIGDPYIYPSEGSAHRIVTFRLVVFRPFVGEILTGRIMACSRDGLRVTLGFFNDIHVPANLIQNNVSYDQGKKRWIWQYNAGADGEAGGDGEGGEGAGDLTLEQGDEVRIRIRSLHFTEVKENVKSGGVMALTTTESPAVATISGSTVGGGAGAGNDGNGLRRRSSSMDVSSPEEAPAPMHIIAQCNEDGLGNINWW